MAETIMVPVDGSPLSLRALRYALEKFPEGDVLAIHVSDMYDPGYGTDGTTLDDPPFGSDAWQEMERETAEEVLAEAEAVAEEMDREIHTETAIGDPERFIPDYAREEGVEHIVLGVHGREEEDRQLFGRVAESVVYRSPVSVTIIR